MEFTLTGLYLPNAKSITLVHTPVKEFVAYGQFGVGLLKVMTHIKRQFGSGPIGLNGEVDVDVVTVVANSR